MATEILIDVQGFVDVEGQFLPKEVAVTSLNQSCIAHWIVTPPYAFDYLEAPEKRQNNWLSSRYHGIEWQDGEISIRQLEKRLCEIARQAVVIYVRGREKAAYLEKVTSRQIRNLEDISPPFRSLSLTLQFCAFHAITRNNQFMCALHNVLNLRKWVSINKKMVDETFINVCASQDATRISPLADNETSPEEGYDTIDYACKCLRKLKL